MLFRCFSTVSVVSGVPSELRSHMCRIYRPTKSTMQSGTANSRYWKIGNLMIT